MSQETKEQTLALRQLRDHLVSRAMSQKTSVDDKERLVALVVTVDAMLDKAVIRVLHERLAQLEDKPAGVIRNVGRPIGAKLG
jgi:hypothetical protein